MDQLIAVVLICAASTPLEACTRSTALEVHILPGMPTPMSCALASQLTLAREPERLEDAYPRTLCEHRKG